MIVNVRWYPKKKEGSQELISILYWIVGKFRTYFQDKLVEEKLVSLSSKSMMR